MNISFKSHFPWPGPDGKPEKTHFSARIQLSLGEPVRSDHLGGDPMYAPMKLHTIRRAAPDGTCRYRAGMPLHMVTGSRFKPERFAVAECTGVQPIFMALQTIPETVGRMLMVDVDGMAYTNSRIKQLAQNDGLSLDQFTKWFLLDIIQHGPFTGHIIHWTNLRY